MKLRAILTVIVFSLSTAVCVEAGTFDEFVLTDQTPTAPLANPVPASYHPRYISGFGVGDAFTVFFEDRDAGGRRSPRSRPRPVPEGFAGRCHRHQHHRHPLRRSRTGRSPSGRPPTPTAPGESVGNNADHHFYVSNDLTTWTLVSTFTIPNAGSFTNALGFVYYGFHDVILLNGTYYALGESNQGQTMIVRSVNGDDVWEAFASIGGSDPWTGLSSSRSESPSAGPRPAASSISASNRGMGKVYADPRDSDFYLAVNIAAQASLAPAALEAAFINPANWTWHDDTTGPAAEPGALSHRRARPPRVLAGAAGRARTTAGYLMYDADFGAADGGRALGYATTEATDQPAPSEAIPDGHRFGWLIFACLLLTSGRHPALAMLILSTQ